MPARKQYLSRMVRLSNPVNWQHPRVRGLVAWWLVLPGWTGRLIWKNLVKPRGRAEDGTLTSMNNANSGWRSTTRPGGFGHVLFDGTAAHVECGTGYANFLKTDPFSGFCWMKTTVGAATGLITKWDAAGGGWQFAANPSHLSFAILNGAGTALRNRIGGSTVNDGKWHHVGWVYTGSNTAAGITTYTDGTADSMTLGTDTDPGALADTALWMGNRSNAGLAYFPGPMDDAMIFKYALPAAEVKQLYDLSRRGYPGLLNRVEPRKPAAGGATGLLMRRRRFLLGG